MVYRFSQNDITEEDSDLLRIITAYDALLKASAIAMFQHGIHSAVQLQSAEE